MECLNLFSGENMKNVLKCLLKFLTRVLEALRQLLQLLSHEYSCSLISYPYQPKDTLHGSLAMKRVPVMNLIRLYQ